MSDTSIQPISSIRAGEIVSQTVLPANTFSEIAATRKPAASPEPEKAPAANSANAFANVSIHFRIDEKTQTLTIFVVDRASKQVLRSIPASELYKLQAGDLLKLTA